MVVHQKGGIGRKATGGRYKQHRSKRQYESGSRPTHTRVGDVDKKSHRQLGGSYKVKLAAANIVNLFDPKSKTYQKATIQRVVENPANRHFVRRNVMTQGAVVETDKGNAKITNRPGQEGAINATLLHK